jgi:hypothetical protein
MRVNIIHCIYVWIILRFFLASTSYINHLHLNVFYSLFLIYEYQIHQSIENAKNVALITALSKSIYNTYIYVDNFHFYLILTSSVTGVFIYKVRYILHEYGYKTHMLLLTYLFHICIMNIMYVSSITANHPLPFDGISRCISF